MSWYTFAAKRGHGRKEIVKSSLKKGKKPECPRRSVRKTDVYVIDYACEDACVKVANVKSLKKCYAEEGEGGGGSSQVPT